MINMIYDMVKSDSISLESAEQNNNETSFDPVDTFFRWLLATDGTDGAL